MISTTLAMSAPTPTLVCLLVYRVQFFFACTLCEVHGVSSLLLPTLNLSLDFSAGLLEAVLFRALGFNRKQIGGYST